MIAVDRPGARQSNLLARTRLADRGLDSMLPVIIHDLLEPAIPNLGPHVVGYELFEEG